jgi:hypothetical protein
VQRSPCPQKDLGSATYAIELSNPFVESPAALSLNTTIFIIYWDPIGLKHAAGRAIDSAGDLAEEMKPHTKPRNGCG